MSSIAGITCAFVKGALAPAAAEAVERWHMPGIDGDGIALLGASGVACQLRAIFYSNSEGLPAWYAEVQSLQGQYAEVVNDIGQAALLFVEKVGQLQVAAAWLPGGAVTLRGEIQIDCYRDS